MKKQTNINSQNYWDVRFSTDWELLHGPAQSRQFAWIAVKQLPEWLLYCIRRDSLTVVDWGCAQGDGTDVWASYVPAKNLYGVDFSSAAIEQASDRYPLINFQCSDWLSESEKSVADYDIVFSSNTLEHFSNPYEVLQRLTKRAKKAVVLLLPYKEINRIAEHEFTFLPQNIPAKLNDDFSLVCGRVSGPHEVWAGEQVLLIYAKDDWIIEQNLKLQDIFANPDNMQALEMVSEEKSLRIAILEKELLNARLDSAAHIQRMKNTEDQLRIELRNNNILLQAAVSEVDAANENLQEYKISNQSLYKQFLDLKGSASWRVTSPLRTAYRFISQIGTPLFLKLPVGVRRGILNKINPSVHPANGSSNDALVGDGNRNKEINYRALEPVSQLPRWVKLAQLADKLAIIPCGFEFDELVNQRPINAAKYFASKGYYVLFIAWQWKPNEKLVKGCDQVNAGIYQVPLFEFIDNYKSLASKKLDALYLLTMPAKVLVDCVSFLRGKGFAIAYDIMDEWQEFFNSGQAPWYEKDIEEQLVLQSDIVSAVAPALVDKFSGIRDDILLIGNGYSGDMLGRECRGISQPLGSPEIVVGYFGHLTDAWFDWDLMLDLAARYADVKFEIIGYGEPQWVRDRVNGIKNLRLVGKVHPSELKNYVAKWNVGMIPFVEGNLSNAVDPIKIYEYIYFGLPVFVTGIQHVKTYPGVEWATKESVSTQFADFLKKAPPDAKLVDDFLKETSWTARFNFLLENMQQRKSLGDLYGL